MKPQINWNKQKLDYSDVNTEALPPLEPGLYRAKITEAKLQPTKKGDPMVVITAEVFEDGAGNTIPKRTLRDNVVLTDKAKFRTKILANALDIPPLEELDEEPAQDFCKEVVTAAKDGVWIRVKHEQYEKDGETRTAMRVARYLSEKEIRQETATSPNSNGASNGAAEPATRRPRRGEATATA